MSQDTDTYYRTTPARTGKMMAIMLGICIAGGAIFFGMWDYWISEPAPVVALLEDLETEFSLHTGNVIDHHLTFVESDDLTTLAFNALPGEENSNPTFHMHIGDKAVFEVVNEGKTPHAFGITASPQGLDDVMHGFHDATGSIFLWLAIEPDTLDLVPGSEFTLLDTTLGPGFFETAEFIPGETGVYYYVCTIPGHRELGMVGQIIVTPPPDTDVVEIIPTDVSLSFILDFVESQDFVNLAFNALPGEEGYNPEIRVNSGDLITVSSTNLGRSFHAFGVVTDPDDIDSVVWDSAIASVTNPLRPGEGGEVTFLAGAPGEYYYICTVPGHAIQGMQGSFIVE